MAAIILSRGALSFCAKDVYHKLDNAQEQLFAYFYHLDKGDEQSANTAFSEYIRLGDIAIQAKRELMKNTPNGRTGEKKENDKLFSDVFRGGVCCSWRGYDGNGIN